MSGEPNPQQEKHKNLYIIFEEEDFAKIEKADRKLYTAPLKAMGLFTGMVYFYKYLSSKQILANPLAQPSQ